MNFKLDENIGKRGTELLRSAGHNVVTIRDQGLQGADDEAIFKICCAEDRALILLEVLGGANRVRVPLDV